MTVTPTNFRDSYPEFMDQAAYPDSAISFWIAVAAGVPGPPQVPGLLNQCRWGRQFDLATQMFVAHYLVLERKAQNEAAYGGLPGQATGPASSKSVDKVSQSFDTSSASYDGAGHWNLTTYGTRLWQLVQMFGMGPIYVGAGYAPYPLAMPYSGPWFFEGIGGGA